MKYMAAYNKQYTAILCAAILRYIIYNTYYNTRTVFLVRDAECEAPVQAQVLEGVRQEHRQVLQCVYCICVGVYMYIGRESYIYKVSMQGEYVVYKYIVYIESEYMLCAVYSMYMYVYMLCVYNM